MVPAALELLGSRELHVLLVQLHDAGLFAYAIPHARIPLLILDSCGHQNHMNWFRLGHVIPSGPRSISLGDSVGTSRKGTPTPLGLLAGEYTAGIARDHLCPPRGSAQK